MEARIVSGVARKGMCAACGRWIRLTKLDEVWGHGNGEKVWPIQRCPGSNQPAKTGEGVRYA